MAWHGVVQEESPSGRFSDHEPAIKMNHTGSEWPVRSEESFVGVRTFRSSWKRVRSPEDAAGEEQAPTDDVESAEDTTVGGTFFHPGVVFEGNLSLQGDFVVESEFHGQLETDGRITIGLEGSVEGGLRAREVVIRGAVVGDVRAERSLVLESTGRLHGDVETPCLEIAKHGYFAGRSTMIEPFAHLRRSSADVSSKVPTPTVP